MFEGRHPFPGNPPAVFSGFDFGSMTPEITPEFENLCGLMATGQQVRLYVSGLTPALSWLMFELAGHLQNLTLLHYDRDSNEYQAQNLVA